MRNLIVGVVLAFILLSCKDSKEIEKKEEKNIKTVEDTVVKDSSHESKIVLNEDFKNQFDILLPRGYRSYNNENPANSLSPDWIDLYEENGEYYLGKAAYKIEKGFDECVGDSLKSIIPKNKSILFMDYPELKSGRIKSLKIDKDKIWPKEKVTFTFNNVEYTLRGEGKVLSSEKVVRSEDNTEEVFKNVANYKLYLTTAAITEKLLLKEDSFHETFVVLLFAGDIDGDGKLDFIFNASRDYEEERVILFLSSKAEKEHAVKKVSEIAVQFDC